METLLYTLLDRLSELQTTSISYNSTKPIQTIQSTIYKRHIELCDKQITRNMYTESNIPYTARLDDEIATTQTDIGTYLDDLRSTQRQLQINDMTLQTIRSIRKLYAGISSVLDNTSPSLYHTIYVVGHFNTIVHAITDNYETVIGALKRVADTLYLFEGNQILTEFIPSIVQEKLDPVVKAVFFAYNESVKNTSKYTNTINSYRQCLISFGTLTQTEVAAFISHIVTNYVYTNHNYPPVIFNALQILLDEVETYIDRIPEWDWLKYEVMLLKPLLHTLQYTMSYHEKIKHVVHFEQNCVNNNVGVLARVDCPVSLVCKRIIQSYEYTSIRMNTIVHKLIGNTEDEQQQHPSNDPYNSMRIWICIFIVIFFTVLFTKVSLFRRIRVTTT